MFFKKLLNKLIVRPIIKMKLRKVGSNFRIGHSSYINPPSSFVIGNNFFCGPFAYFSSNAETSIYISDDVMFGPYCKIIGGNHNISWQNGAMVNAPPLGAGKGITIESDVWVGAGATLLDGAFLSEGCVVGAGAVVVDYVAPYCVVGGVPARLIKPRFSQHGLENILCTKGSAYKAEQIECIYSKLGVRRCTK